MSECEIHLGTTRIWQSTTNAPGTSMTAVSLNKNMNRHYVPVADDPELEHDSLPEVETILRQMVPIQSAEEQPSQR